jgi:hypothetical protein
MFSVIGLGADIPVPRKIRQYRSNSNGCARTSPCLRSGFLQVLLEMKHFFADPLTRASRRYLLAVSHISSVCTGLLYLRSTLERMRGPDLNIPLGSVYIVMVGSEITAEENVNYAPLDLSCEQLLGDLVEELEAKRGLPGHQDTSSDVFFACWIENRKRMARGMPGRNGRVAVENEVDRDRPVRHVMYGGVLQDRNGVILR